MRGTRKASVANVAAVIFIVSFAAAAAVFGVISTDWALYTVNSAYTVQHYTQASRARGLWSEVVTGKGSTYDSKRFSLFSTQVHEVPGEVGLNIEAQRLAIPILLITSEAIICLSLILYILALFIIKYRPDLCRVRFGQYALIALCSAILLSTLMQTGGMILYTLNLLYEAYNKDPLIGNTLSSLPEYITKVTTMTHGNGYKCFWLAIVVNYLGFLLSLGGTFLDSKLQKLSLST